MRQSLPLKPARQRGTWIQRDEAPHPGIIARLSVLGKRMVAIEFSESEPALQMARQ
jgi:hypothetical protein